MFEGVRRYCMISWLLHLCMRIADAALSSNQVCCSSCQRTAVEHCSSAEMHSHTDLPDPWPAPPRQSLPQFNLGAVNPCKGNSQYAMLYASPETETQREVFK